MIPAKDHWGAYSYCLQCGHERQDDDKPKNKFGRGEAMKVVRDQNGNSRYERMD